MGREYLQSTNRRHLLSAEANRARFLTLPAANRIAPDTRRDQAVALRCERPGGICHPRETLVPSRVQCVVTLRVAVCVRRQSLGGSRLGDSVICSSIGWRKDGVQSFALVARQSAYWLTAFGQTVMHLTQPAALVERRVAEVVRFDPEVGRDVFGHLLQPPALLVGEGL